jgi:hypothetical protein
MTSINHFNFNNDNGAYAVMTYRITNCLRTDVGVDIDLKVDGRTRSCDIRVGDDIIVARPFAQGKLLDVGADHVIVKPAKGRRLKMDLERFAALNLC